MSSIASAFALLPPEEQAKKVYGENDWFPLEEADIKDKSPEEYVEWYLFPLPSGRNTDRHQHRPFASGMWYCAAKKYAEQAGFKFVEENKPKWAFSTFLPPSELSVSLLSCFVSVVYRPGQRDVWRSLANDDDDDDVRLCHL